MNYLSSHILDLVAYIIIAAAFAAAGYKIWRFFRAPSPRCASCCKDCPYAGKK